MTVDMDGNKISRLYSNVGITKVFIKCNEVTGSSPLFPWSPADSRL